MEPMSETKLLPLSALRFGSTEQFMQWILEMKRLSAVLGVIDPELTPTLLALVSPGWQG